MSAKWLIITGAVLAVIAAFVGGFFIGRQFPAHHYERFGNGPNVLDTTTGKVCDPQPMTDAERDARKANIKNGLTANELDAALSKSKTEPTPSSPTGFDKFIASLPNAGPPKPLPCGEN